MSRLSLVHLFHGLLQRGTDAARSAVAAADPGMSGGRLPVAISDRTRAFLEAQAPPLGHSMSSLASTILDAVVASTLEVEGGTTSYRSIAERIQFVISEHGLSMPGAAEHLNALGLDAAQLRSGDALQAAITNELLEDLAKFFFVNREWLAGRDRELWQGSSFDWYKRPGGGAARILNAFDRRTVAVKVLISTRGALDNRIDDDRSDAEEMTSFLPVLVITSSSGHEELVRYVGLEDGRYSYWKCRRDLKILTYLLDRAGVSVDAYAVEQEVYRRVHEAEVLPCSAFKRAARVAHLDDFVRGKREEAEWKDIQADAYFATQTRLFAESVKDPAREEA